MRAPSRIAWSLWGLSVILTVFFVAVIVLHWGGPGPLGYEQDVWVIPILVLLFLTFPTIGAIVASRRPENLIGWLFCGAGISMSGGFFAQGYAEYALLDNIGLWGGQGALWVSSWLGIVGLFITPVYLLFLFPTGRPASPRWARLLVLFTGIVAIGVVALMLKPGPVEPFDFPNPLGVGGAVGDVLDAVDSVFSIFAIPAFLFGAVSMVQRARRARGDERLQIRWFAFTAAVVGVGFTVSFATSALGGASWLADAGFIVGVVALVFIPVSSGVAILKYRLYDIDRIINRALVYGAVTAVLVTGYAGMVLLIQSVLPVPNDSPAAVAISTLAMAAIFRPLRARIQDLVDRRFYRARYDAAHAIDSFGARLRNQTDLDSLASDLIGVVTRTVQPAHASLWLMESRGRPAGWVAAAPAGTQR